MGGAASLFGRGAPKSLLSEAGLGQDISETGARGAGFESSAGAGVACLIVEVSIDSASGIDIVVEVDIVAAGALVAIADP